MCPDSFGTLAGFQKFLLTPGLRCKQKQTKKIQTKQTKKYLFFAAAFLCDGVLRQHWLG
jgi:hypothetical protein